MTGTLRYCVTFPANLAPMLCANGCAPLSKRVPEGSQLVTWDLGLVDAAHLAWLVVGGRRGPDLNWWRILLPMSWPAPRPLPGGSGAGTGMIWVPSECVEGGGVYRHPRSLAEVWAASPPAARVECESGIRALLLDAGGTT